MQTRAIIEAACRLNKEGLKVVPEIMIPLVGHVKELRDQKAVVDRVAAETMKAQGVKIKYLVGTMIEVPRGAMTADQIAAGGAVLLVRHQRPHAADLRVLARRRRQVPADLPGQEDPRQGSVRVDRRRRRRRARPDRRRARAQDAARSEARHLRRARRRPGVDPLLREGRASTTSAPRRTACRSRGWRRRRRRCRSRSETERELELAHAYVRCSHDLRPPERPDRAGHEHRPRLAQSGVGRLPLGRPRRAVDSRVADPQRHLRASIRCRSRTRCARSAVPEDRSLRRLPLRRSCTASTSATASTGFATHDVDFFLGPNYLVTVHDGHSRVDRRRCRTTSRATRR